jgi:hypothetical protein
MKWLCANYYHLQARSSLGFFRANKQTANVIIHNTVYPHLLFRFGGKVNPEDMRAIVGKLPLNGLTGGRIGAGKEPTGELELA